MIDKKRITELHADLDATLKAFAAKHNLSVSPFNISYTASGFKCTVQFGDRDEIGDDTDPKWARNLQRYGFFLGLNDKLNKQVTVDGKTVTVLGMTGPKKVIYADSDGKKWVRDAGSFSRSMVK